MRVNEPLSSITHLIGAAASLAVLTCMVIFSALHQSPSAVVGSAIFGSSLFLLYLASTLYHFFSENTKPKRVFQRIDHAMIYVLIAGTYTPIALSLPERAWGWTFLGLVWGFATLGVTFKALGKGVGSWHSPVSYLLLGWMIAIAWGPLSSWLPKNALWLLFVGGIFYSVGSIFYALDDRIPRSRWFGMHEVFHLFVLAGSACHIWLVFEYIILTSR